MNKELSLNQYFKSIIDADTQPVVICDLDNTIIYMNASAIKRYYKTGGSRLIGRSIFDCHNPESVERIEKCLEWFALSDENNTVFTYNHSEGEEDFDVYVIALRDDLGRLIGYYEKHESRVHDKSRNYAMSGSI